MAVQIQIRRGTESEWTNDNPVLAEGELGVELDTGRFKMGDGQTEWNDIDYSTGPEGPSAYEVAVDNGYPFDEQTWLDSLVGPTGSYHGPQIYTQLTEPQGVEDGDIWVIPLEDD